MVTQANEANERQNPHQIETLKSFVRLCKLTLRPARTGSDGASDTMRTTSTGPIVRIALCSCVISYVGVPATTSVVSCECE